MKLNLETVLGALPSLIAAATGVAPVASLIEEIIDSFDAKPDEQAVIREAADDLRAENDEGHARYQAKLAEAAKR